MTVVISQTFKGRIREINAFSAYEIFLTNHRRRKIESFFGIALPTLWLIGLNCFFRRCPHRTHCRTKANIYFIKRFELSHYRLKLFRLGFFGCCFFYPHHVRNWRFCQLSRLFSFFADFSKSKKKKDSLKQSSLNSLFFLFFNMLLRNKRKIFQTACIWTVCIAVRIIFDYFLYLLSKKG